MYHVSAQGVDECMINVHYYHYDDETQHAHFQVSPFFKLQKHLSGKK